MDDPRFELVGTASVDSGMLAIIDPCYVMDWIKSHNKEDGHLNEAFEATTKEERCGHIFSDLAFCFESGWGDGTYDIYARKEGKRIAEIRIILIDEESEYNEDDGDV